MNVPCKNMSHEEWLKERKKGIGGSDAGAILGVNKFKTPFLVWKDKTTNEIDEGQSEPAYWGNQLENIVAKEFEKRSGKKVRHVNKIYFADTYPFMMANIDREVVGENAILECKTTGFFNSKEWDGEEIPASYIVQVQHYLYVRGADKAYIACLIGGQKFIWKEIKRDEELIGMIIEAESEFWNNYILTGEPPEIDGSEGASAYLNKIYASDDGQAIQLTSEYEKLAREHMNLKEQEKSIKEAINEVENKIKAEMKQAQTGITNTIKIDWKTVSSNRVDSKALKTEYPEIYKKVCKSISSRRFTVKEIV